MDLSSMHVMHNNSRAFCLLHTEYSEIQSLPLSSVVNFSRSNIAPLRSENYDTGQ